MPLLSAEGVEVLHVNHHSSKSSTNSDWMNLLTPEVAVISVGAGQPGSFQHPRKDVVEGVLLAGAPCITAPAALVLQTEEGSTTGPETSFEGFSVGDIIITTDGLSYAIDATGEVSQGPDERAQLGLPLVFPQEAQMLYVAQFGNGQGFTSQTVLTNPSASATVAGRIDFLDDNGDPLPVGIVDVGAAATTLTTDPLGITSSVNFSVQPLGVVTISTDGQGGLVAGSAVVTSDGALGGVIRFSIPGVGIAGVGASQPLEGFIVPVRRQAGGINTGLAIHNTENQPVTLTLTLRDKQGQEVATRTIENFAARGHLAQFIGGQGDVLFPGADTDDFQGTVTVVVTGGKVAATALELGQQPGQFTTLPVSPVE